MKINFKIKNVSWKIEFVHSDDTRLSHDDENLGKTHVTDKVIFIDNNLKTIDLSNTIIHELTHAFVWEYGFQQVDFNLEVVCDFIGNYLLDIHKIYMKIMSELEKEKKLSNKSIGKQNWVWQANTAKSWKNLSEPLKTSKYKIFTNNSLFRIQKSFTKMWKCT